MADYTPEWAEPITGIDSRNDPAHRPRICRGRAQRHGAPWLAHFKFHQLLPDRARHRHSECARWATGRHGDVSLHAGEAAGAAGQAAAAALPADFGLAPGRRAVEIPLRALKLGVFQELRDAVINGAALPGARLVHLTAESGALAPRPASEPCRHSTRWISSPWSISFMNDTAWFSDVVLPEASYLERYDPLLVRRRESLSSPAGDRAARRSKISPVDL